MVKICTYNVNSIKARKDLVLSWLEKRGGDIDALCFQELKVTDDAFPREDFEKRGYHCAVFGQKAYNGVAICTKTPVENIRRGFEDESWDEQSRLLTVEWEGFHLMNVYAPHGDLPGQEKFAYKQDWYARFIEFLNSRFSPKDRLLVVGDFNVAREDRDVYSPEKLEGSIGTLPEERRVFQELLDWGLQDVYRKLEPDGRTYTWWDYRTAGIWRDEGMRIDYILATDDLAGKIGSIEVDLWPRRRRTPTPSDHAPVVAGIDLNGAG